LVALVKARLGKEIYPAANEARDHIEKLVIEDGYLQDAPFSWISLAIKYGLKNDLNPEIGRIDRSYGDLELAIEISTQDLLGQTKERMSEVLRRASLRALVGAGQHYTRPMTKLNKELDLMELN